MNRGKKPARAVAYAAVFGATALAILYLASIAPTGVWGLVAVAGLFPAAAVMAAGLKAGFLCWAGAAILGFFLLPEKLTVLLFGALFGLYPMVKAVAERIGRRAGELLVKLAFFNASLTAICAVMRAAVFAALPAVLRAEWILYAAGNVIFLVYDYGLSKLFAFYMVHIQRKLR